MKTKALIDRREGRDIFDIGFLIHHFPKHFNDKNLMKIKEKLDITGYDAIKKLFKKDIILSRFNSDAIVDLIYKDMDNMTKNLKEINNNIDVRNNVTIPRRKK